jgi:DNA-binding GntR family transcriptional regulator
MYFKGEERTCVQEKRKGSLMEMKWKLSQEYLGLPEYIAQTLADNIINGEYAEDERLKELDIQKEFGVSKTPIREALRILHSLRVVEIKPRRGCFVRNIALSDIEDNYEVRWILEGHAAKKSYDSISEQQLEKVKNYYQRLKGAAEDNNIREYAHSHTLMHLSIVEGCKNKLLTEICDRLRFQNVWYLIQYLELDLISDLKGHDCLIEHFISRDVEPSEIQRLVEEHIQTGLTNYREYILRRNMKAES